MNVSLSCLCLKRSLRALMDISAPVISLADRPRRAIRVTGPTPGTLIKTTAAVFVS
jgi:hypothetical protein